MSLHLEPYDYAKHTKHQKYHKTIERCAVCLSRPEPSDVADAVLANLENTYADIKALFGEQPELDKVIEKLYAESEDL